MFPRSLNSLAADGQRWALGGVCLGTILLAGWSLWFLWGQVAVFAVSETARLESDQAGHPLAVPVAGRVVATHLVVGQLVQARRGRS